MNTKEKLDRLDTLRAMCVQEAQQFQIQIDMLNKEIEERTYGLTSEMKRLEKEIRSECLDLQQSVRGDHPEDPNAA